MSEITRLKIACWCMGVAWCISIVIAVLERRRANKFVAETMFKTRGEKVKTKMMVMVLLLCAVAHGQEEKKTHSFLVDRWNTPLLVVEGGVHVWSGRGHNDLVNDQFSAPQQIHPEAAAFHGVHNSYSYLKEFGIMSGAVSLAALLHSKGHHRWERALLFADVGGSLFQGFSDKRRYSQVDCQFNHFDCH